MSTYAVRLGRSSLERGVLLDTSAIFGALDEDDQWHQRAARGFHLLSQEQRPLYVTSITIAETHGLIVSRLDDLIGLAWLDNLTGMNVEHHLPDDHRQVLEVLRRNMGRAYSYGDAFSFLVMQRVGIHLAYTFDRHFQEYGWEIFPGPLP